MRSSGPSQVSPRCITRCGGVKGASAFVRFITDMTFSEIYVEALKALHVETAAALETA